jgi:MSHA biogenesis protein MshL
MFTIQNNIEHKLVVVMGFALVSMAGCSIYTEPEQIRETSEITYESARDFRSEKPKYKNISIADTLFVRQLSSDEAVKPAWYFNDSHISYKKAPFGVIINGAFSDVSVNFKYVDGVDLKKIISVKSSSTIGGALKSISNAAGYSYSVDNNTITFSKFQTKTYDIAMIPGIEEFGVGKKGGGQQSSGSGNDKQSIITSSDEYAHTEGKIDIYTDLGKTLPLLLSTEGKFELNPATTSLIVKDYPANISKISEYIYEQNEKMTRQVAIDMTIIDVQFDDSTQFGVDWGLVSKQLGSKDYGTSLGSSFLDGVASASFAPMILDATINKGRLSGTSMLIQALQSQGTVSTRSYPRSVSLNNRVAKLRSIVRENYISEQKITNTINVGSESSITQASVETGFSMYALPKIYKDEVIMRLTTNLSTLLEMQKKGSTSSDGKGTQVLVEAPKVADKDFDNSIIIRSGNTLLIAGLSKEAETSSDANAGTELLGVSKTSNKIRVETIIAITPTILRGVRS